MRAQMARCYSRSAGTEPSPVNSPIRSAGSYGVFGHRVAHTGARVEGSSLPPDVPQGMDAGAELLAGRAGRLTYRKNKNPFQKMAGLRVTLAGGSVISEWPSDQLMGNYVCCEENSDLAQVYGGR
jgi:hypothetical protein